jgi:hypothetical protein
MTLASLVAQLMIEPVSKKKSTRSPICQRCKMQPRAIAVVSGKMADYCKACKRDLAYASNARRKQEANDK